VLQSAFDWFNNLSPAVKGIVGPILGVVASIGPLLLAGAKVIKMWQSIKAAFLIMKAAFVANPWVLIIAAIVALVIIVVKNWDKIKRVILNAWRAVLRFSKRIWGNITGFFRRTAERVRKIWRALVDRVKAFWRGLRDALKRIGKVILKVVLAPWRTARRVLKTIWSAIKTVVRNALDVLKKWFLNFTGPGLIIKHWKTIKRAFRTGVDTAKRVVRNLVDKVLGSFRKLRRIGGAVLGKLWSGIKTAVRTVRDVVKKVWNGIVDFFKKIPGRITRATKDIFKGLWEAFKDAINSIIRSWNNLSFRIGGQHVNMPGPIPDFTIPTITLSTPNIPTLHQGGLFRSAVPGGEGFALLRDRERISEPFGRIDTGTRERPQVIQLVVDSRVLAEVLVRHEEGLK
jgi:phage-related protein